MSYPTHTTWERLSSAVLGLASGQESIQTRLYHAYQTLSALQTHEFPKELQSEFEALRKNLTKVEPSGDEGSILATTRIMSSEEAARMAEKIFDMYDTVAREYCTPDR